jgi:superfamily II DNA or RNA helicase
VNIARPVPVPEVLTALLRDYQVPAVAQLAGGMTAYNAQLDASSMGTGKTYNAIATSVLAGYKPLVLCRKAAFSSWHRCFKHFGITNYEVTNYEKVRTGKGPWGTWVMEKAANGRSYERFRWGLSPNMMLILDEVHWCSSPTSQNGTMLMSAAFQRIPLLMLSATAASNPEKMCGIGYALGLHRGKNEFYPWMLAHGMERGKYGMKFTCDMQFWQYMRRQGDKWVEIPAGIEELQRRRNAVMGMIHQQIFGAGKGVRLRSEDIPGFPKNDVYPVALDFDDATPAIRAAYEELKFELAEAKRKKLPAGAVFKKALMKVELLKVPIVAQEAQCAIEEGYSVPIFVNYTETLNALKALLKTDCVVHGDQTDIVRSRNVDAFQANTEPVIICNNQAGGESISLHDLHGGHPRCALVFPTFWAETLRQCLGRTPRNGGLTPVIQKIIFAAGTDEEGAMNTSERKLMQLDTLNDNDLRPQFAWV